MPDERPRDPTILQLLDADLAGKSAVRLVEDVLRRDFDALAQVLAAEEQVERWRGDDDFCGVFVSRSALSSGTSVFGRGSLPDDGSEGLGNGG